ncbi:hypothetical protein ACFQ14_11425 [Pseudahrensia aquimaris]|uniref:Yip1 domain-containing protein n=1 Tax=Pseudahrensia aquimaris TaxID=744461 RepID=A0ABW3FFV7_9HYPH
MTVIANLSAATDVILGRERGLERLDTSADGFYRSFKGLALVALIDGAIMVFTHGARFDIEVTKIENPLVFAATMLFIALMAYIASMLALFLLCRTEDLQRRFSTAVIVHNWASPVVSLIFAVPFFVLLKLEAFSHPEPSGSLATIILFGAIACLVVIGVRLLRISLSISNGQAFTFFAISAGVSLLIDLWFNRLFGL